MRSMPRALLWETTSHGRWTLPGMFLLGNGIPLLVYGSILGIGVNTADPAFVVLQFSFLPLIILQFAIGIAVAQGPMSRLFTTPMSSNAIVAWHSISGAAILALETGLAACLYNSLFNADWPILGPMLFAATAWSALQLLQFIPSQPSLSGLCLAGGPLFAVLLWVLSRYGSWLSAPTHYWREVTFSDVMTLTMSASTCYAMACVAVRYARCGESLPRLGLSNWLVRRWESLTLGTHGKSQFRSAVHAQMWYEFRLKGWGLPFISSLVMLLALSLVAFGVITASQKLSEVYEFILALGAMQSVFAFLFGAIFAIENNSIAGEKRETGGQVVAETIRYESMGGFLSVRPISNGLFSQVILWTIAKSVFLSNAMWVGVLATALIAMWLTSHLPAKFMPPMVGAWFLPLAFLGPWICMANAASIAFVARRGAQVGFAGLGILIGYIILTSCIPIPRQAVLQIHATCISVVSVLIVLVTFWVFDACRRANHLSTKTLVLSASAAVGILIAAFLLRPSGAPFVVYPLMFATASLAVLPISAMPLTISASRHR
jgi:hypothetical protein